MTRRPRKQRPDPRLVRIASIVTTIAPMAVKAREHVNEELSSLGFRSGSSFTGRVSGGSRSDTTQTDGATAATLTTWQNDYQDRVKALESATSALFHHIRLRLPAEERPAAATRFCSDVWMGRDGWNRETGSPDWAPGETECYEIGDHCGLCGRHRLRERRWREENGYPSREIPAEAAS